MKTNPPEYVKCPWCGNEQTDMGRNVACEECGKGPMPSPSSATLPVPPTPLQQFAREMGARGGRIGGKRRLETMTPEQRSKIAKKAAKARWAKAKSKSKSKEGK